MPWAPAGSSVHSRVLPGEPARPAGLSLPRPGDTGRGPGSSGEERAVYRSAPSLGPIGAGLTQVYSFRRSAPRGFPAPPYPGASFCRQVPLRTRAHSRQFIPAYSCGCGSRWPVTALFQSPGTGHLRPDSELREFLGDGLPASRHGCQRGTEVSGHSRVQGSWGTLTERSRTAKEEVPRRSREKVTKKEHGPGVDAAGGDLGDRQL